MSLKFKPGSVGELMHPSPLVLNENKTIEDAIIELKKIHKDKHFTYGIIVDDANDVVTGVLVFKDVFYHEPNTVLKDVCLKNPILLKADDDVLKTFIKVAGKQIPEFPVVDDEGKTNRNTQRKSCQRCAWLTNQRTKQHNGWCFSRGRTGFIIG